MKICIVGTGFVGEATGKVLSKLNNEVTFIDTDVNKVEKLRNENFVAYTPKNYTTIDTDITMFCVPTPTIGNAIDLSYLKNAITDFSIRLKNYNNYHTIVIRSTVQPGTSRNTVLPIIEKISGKKAGKNFGLVMQPEYLREATAIEDYENPRFILIGALDKKCGDIISKIYIPFKVNIEICTLEEAEFQKYVHNVFNAVKIVFFNELRIVANNMGWDANKIFLATAKSSEGMWNPLYGIKDYGPFDGSCLPKDIIGLLEWANNNNFDLEITKTAIIENMKHELLLGVNKNVRVNYLNKIKI